MTTKLRDEIEDFNPLDAQTWDDKQNAVYEVGYQKGESCANADWLFMLDEGFNINAGTPQEAQTAIKALIAQEANQAALRELTLANTELYKELGRNGSSNLRDRINQLIADEEQVDD